ncbi:hypothetical protein QJQ45_016294 [Haematococcus lacustris]|nr:hypothetical protein QJQ45_016294 [Haematococcus lacustris]
MHSQLPSTKCTAHATHSCFSSARSSTSTSLLLDSVDAFAAQPTAQVETHSGELNYPSTFLGGEDALWKNIDAYIFPYTSNMQPAWTDHPLQPALNIATTSSVSQILT